METSFTPWLSLAGGLMIGTSVVLLMATAGRIAGISGITSRLFARDTDADARRVSGFFALGLLLAAPLWALTLGGWPEQWVVSDPLRMAAAGLLVGFGAVFGSGCTSGHGVAGIARGSGRSITATVTFVFAAIVTVFVYRHLIGG